MSDETLRTLITCGFTFGGILVSNLFVFLGTRSHERKTKQNSILEQQYKNFFVPLHRAIFFSDLSDIEIFECCEKLIKDNYELIPPKIKTDFLDFYKDNHLSNEFENNINHCYIELSNKLGYSKIQLEPKDKETVQNILLDTLTSSILETQMNIISEFLGRFNKK
ncbi:MAG: hypothetical protein HFJ98_00275 [Eubacterium sp.]|nr:hypothetical protein [Eubacterium sp.]